MCASADKPRCDNSSVLISRGLLDLWRSECLGAHVAALTVVGRVPMHIWRCTFMSVA